MPLSNSLQLLRTEHEDKDWIAYNVEVDMAAHLGIYKTKFDTKMKKLDNDIKAYFKLNLDRTTHILSDHGMDDKGGHFVY